MMGEFVMRNLFHRPMRTLIGVLAIGVEIMLVVVIVGLTSGMLQETAKRIEGIGADIMVQAPAAQILIGFSGSPMPIKMWCMGLTRNRSGRSRGDSCFWPDTTCKGQTICWWTTGRRRRSI